MYCKNCGNELNENSVACLKCGCDPKKGNNNCPSCGVETNSSQVICVKCGVSLKNQGLSIDAEDLVNDLKNSMSNLQQYGGGLGNSSKIALAASILAIICIFLPWVEASTSANFGGYLGGYSSSYSSGGISGISIGGGVFGLIVALIGGFMVFKKFKYAFIAGIANLFDGLGYILGWFGESVNTSYDSSYFGVSASASVEPQIGLYLFVLASLIFVVFTTLNFKDSKK